MKINNEDNLKVFINIKKNPNLSQRKLAEDVGISLGKLNYCISALRDKGLVKIKNFKNNPDKLKYCYYLTPKGMKEKTKLTLNFMKRKMNEYDELKRNLEN